MVSNRLAFLGVVVACVSAAGVGSYIATRQNTVAPVEAAAAPQAIPGPEASAAPVEAPAVAAQPRPVPAAPLTANRVGAAPAPRVAPVAPAPATVVRSQPVERSVRSQSTQATAVVEPAPVERTWPAAALPVSTTAGNNVEPPPQPLPVEEKDANPEPPARRLADLVVPADSVIGFRTDSRLSSERSRVEDRVEARVVRDVRVAGEIAVPAGTKAIGTVVTVERGGKFKERAGIGIRFDELQLADGTRLPLSTDTIFRYGDAPGNSSAAKIGGGAVAGAILGAIIGGGKGAAVGAASGAGAGTGVVASGQRNEAVIAAGSEVTARILAPLTVTVERE